MKKPYIHILIFLLALSAVLSSCQEEVIEVIQPDPASTTTTSSNLSNLVQNATARDGSPDNIIDKASCLSVVYPVTVIVNGEELVITSEDDLDEIEKLFDKSDQDDDEVIIVFPITVILQDHSEITVNNEDELEDLAEECIEEGEDDDIECLDFIYPITITLYDTDNQVADVITITNDEELYKLLDRLDDEDLYSIRFPIEVVLSTGVTVIVNDNDELEDLLEEAEDLCDEDDDNDYDDDDVDDTDLRNSLTEAEWRIVYLFDEGELTSLFTAYTLDFNNDGTTRIFNDEEEIEGEWESSGDDGMLELEFYFGEEEPFEALNEDWDVVSFTDNRIELEDKDVGNGETASLILIKNE